MSSYFHFWLKEKKHVLKKLMGKIEDQLPCSFSLDTGTAESGNDFLSGTLVFSLLVFVVLLLDSFSCKISLKLSTICIVNALTIMHLLFHQYFVTLI